MDICKELERLKHRQELTGYDASVIDNAISILHDAHLLANVVKFHEQDLGYLKQEAEQEQAADPDAVDFFKEYGESQEKQA